jgi:predicted DNA-binding protein
MARPKTDSTVLTIRVPVALEKRIAREARRRRQTRSEVAREILEAGLGPGRPDVAAEARRQSLLANRQRSDRETLRFMMDLADTTGWRGQE